MIRESDDRRVGAAELQARPHATRLTLDDVRPLLAAPDDGVPLDRYPLRDGAPLLLPERLHPYFGDRLSVPFELGRDPFLQYFLLSSIKQSGEINAPASSVPYERHLFRMHAFCADLAGVALDVGCDDPRIGASLLPPAVRYVGLDPFALPSSAFRLIGVAEFLPFRDASVDAVVFNTSLDHVLDHQRAIDEAHRVLAPGGTIVIASIVWTHGAELFRDAVHFHHFREHALTSALGGFEVVRTRRCDYKGDAHRFGLYLAATKR